MKQKSFLIYIIAGEPSGDFIGSKLMKALQQQNHRIHFAGLGGSLMKQAGLNSLFDIKPLSVMGIFEILPRIFQILKLITLTVKDIIAKRPDLIITIDAPGFNVRVVKKIRKILGNKIKIIHYVAPSVWAYKPKRAKKFALLYDYLFCLLPFEPSYFTKEGLNAFFVGHPIVESNISHMLQPEGVSLNHSKPDTLSYHDEETEKNVLMLLPGSRTKEVSRLLPILLNSTTIIRQQYPTLEVAIITIPEVEHMIKQLAKNYKVNIITDEVEKYKMFLQSKIALAASGTVTLELALAHVKTVVVYKLNILTSLLFYMLLKVKFVSLINIMAKKVIFPELLGPNCTSQRVATTAITMINSNLDDNTINNILHKIGYNNFIPSQKAAELTVQILENKI